MISLAYFTKRNIQHCGGPCTPVSLRALLYLLPALQIAWIIIVNISQYYRKYVCINAYFEIMNEYIQHYSYATQQDNHQYETLYSLAY